jgi:preprotein translocase subunit SecB
VRGLELFVVALNGSTCQIKRTAFFEALQDRKKKLSQNLDTEFTAADIGSNHFDGVGRFNIAISSAESEPLVSISCTFEAHIHASSPFPKEFVERFAQSELRLVLTPYARSFIADATARMAIPPVTIPFSAR